MVPDWIYCSFDSKECAKADDFFRRHGVRPRVVIDARKEKYGRLEALRLARPADGVYAVLSKLALYINLRSKRPDVAAHTRALLSPTGNMKSPVVCCGKALIVGFDEELYREVCEIDVPEAQSTQAKAPEPSVWKGWGASAKP